MPSRTPGQEGFNVVAITATGKGNWGRSLVKGHKSPGFLTKSNQAMLALGRYWEDVMSDLHKNYWITRATEAVSRCRDGTNQTVTGYGLFMKSNMAALVLKQTQINYPEDELINSDEGTVYLTVLAETNKVEIYAATRFGDETDWFIEYFISAIHPHHVEGKDPLKFTTLIGKVIPSDVPYHPEPPFESVWLPLPWDVNVGDVVGFYEYKRMGSRNGAPAWIGARNQTIVKKMTAT